MAGLQNSAGKPTFRSRGGMSDVLLKLVRVGGKSAKAEVQSSCR